MSSSAPVAAKTSGLSTVINTIASPAEAFATLRVAPTWGWAALITVILVMIGSFLLLPAQIHAFEAAWPQQVAANPNLAQLPPAQLHRIFAFSENLVRWSWLLAPLFIFIGMLFQTVIMKIFALGSKDVKFGSLWAAAVNIAVPTAGLYSIVIGIIARMRGADTYTTTRDALMTMPSLAWAVPQASAKAATFLAAIQPFSVWAMILIAFAMMKTARASEAISWQCALVILLGAAGLLAVWAR